MSLHMAFALNVLLILLENIMLLFLADSFFRRQSKKGFALISFLVATVLSCMVIYFLGEKYFIKISLLTSVFSLWIFLNYRVPIVKSIYPAVLLLAYLTIVDSGAINLISGLMGTKAQQLIGSPGSYYLICFSTKTIEFFGVVVIHIWLKHHFSQGSAVFFDWLRVLIFPVSTMLVSFFLLRIYYLSPDLSYELAICNGIILSLDVTSIFVLNYLEKQQEALRDNIILRRNMKLELDNIEALRLAYEGQRKQTHDFQNQLAVIYGMIERRSPSSDILNYIGSLREKVSVGSFTIKTYRTAVDIILSQKKAVADSMGIQFSFRLDDLSAFPLQDDALVVLLSNLIDNAIEACNKISDADSRSILLKMRVESEAGFLYIENSTAEPVMITNNHVSTTKENGLEHGYGLQNIVSVLEKANAAYSMDYDHETGRFAFSAQIPMI